MKIQKNIQSLKTSATLAINELSQQLISEGKEVFKFGLGQSPFPVPRLIVDELKNHAHQKDYLNVSGLMELREEVARYHSSKNQKSYDNQNVIIGQCSKEKIIQKAIRPSDHIQAKLNRFFLKNYQSSVSPYQ